MDMLKEKRNINLDIIRCFAVFFVLSVHFFLNSGYYDALIIGKKMYIGTIMRTFFMTCVPLFLMLTGYLMNKKVLSKKYYMGIIKTLCIYILCTICILVYRIVYLKESMSLFFAIINITSFGHYSWYVEMYIGLFLLIPFLNIIYNNLSNKKHKLWLIITLVILVVLPSFVNTFDFLTASWLEQTLIPGNSPKLIPEWWSGIYPFVYYFIGAFLSEYHNDIKVNLKWLFIIFMICLFILGTYSYWRSYKSTFIWGSWGNWGGFITVILSVLFFIFLLKLKTERIPKILKRIIFLISDLSFAIYLLSWIFDNYFYPILILNVPNVPERIKYYFLIVPIIFICSFLIAWFVNFVYCLINAIIKRTKSCK